MKNLFKISFILSVFAIAMVIKPSPAQAQEEGSFDLTVKHNINGISLGADKHLPVDVYVDGELVIPGFTFGQIVPTSLPAGDYLIEVTFADETDVIMSLQTGPVPADVDVTIKAQLSGGKKPALKVRINK